MRALPPCGVGVVEVGSADVGLADEDGERRRKEGVEPARAQGRAELAEAEGVRLVERRRAVEARVGGGGGGGSGRGAQGDESAGMAAACAFGRARSS